MNFNHQWWSKSHCNKYNHETDCFKATSQVPWSDVHLYILYSPNVLLIMAFKVAKDIK